MGHDSSYSSYLWNSFLVFCVLSLISQRLDIHFLYFAFHRYFVSVFAKHTTKYKTLTIHFSYFTRISCFINTTKNKLRNPLTFCVNAHSGAKCEEWKKWCETRKKWWFFLFRGHFCNKCIAGQMSGFLMKRQRDFLCGVWNSSLAIHYAWMAKQNSRQFLSTCWNIIPK